jgi:hypothetical protein
MMLLMLGIMRISITSIYSTHERLFSLSNSVHFEIVTMKVYRLFSIFKRNHGVSLVTVSFLCFWLYL